MSLASGVPPVGVVGTLELPDLDEGLSSVERCQQCREVLFKPDRQLVTACIAAPEPDNRRP
jgi:hypothetical protein